MKRSDRKSNQMAPYSVKEFLAGTCGTEKTTQTVRWPCKSIIL